MSTSLLLLVQLCMSKPMCQNVIASINLSHLLWHAGFLQLNSSDSEGQKCTGTQRHCQWAENTSYEIAVVQQKYIGYSLPLQFRQRLSCEYKYALTAPEMQFSSTMKFTETELEGLEVV